MNHFSKGQLEHASQCVTCESCLVHNTGEHHHDAPYGRLRQNRSFSHDSVLTPPWVAFLLALFLVTTHIAREDEKWMVFAGSLSPEMTWKMVMEK